MRLCSLLLALLPPLFFIAKANASVNATAFPAPLGSFSSTGNRSGTLISESPTARDEERINGIKDFGWENKYANLLAKSMQSLWDRKYYSRFERKLAWWRATNKHPDIIYEKLKQDDSSKDILSWSWFQDWFRYVEMYNSDHPRKKVSIYFRLKKQFTEYEIAVMARKAKSKDDSIAQKIGTTLQDLQLTYWKEQNYSPSTVHELLQWLPSHRMLLYNKVYDIWNMYLIDYLSMAPMPYFDQLLHSFDDRSLSLLLVDSRRSPLTVTTAAEFQLELEKVWLSKIVGPDLAFDYLGLSQRPVRLFDNKELKTWIRYAHLYREEFGEDVTLDEVIASHFNADEVVEIIKTAETDGRKELAELAELIRKNLEKKLAAAVPSELPLSARASESL